MIEKNIFREKLIIWIDETAINDSVYKQYSYSAKNKKKVVSNRPKIKSTTLCLAISKHGVMIY